MAGLGVKRRGYELGAHMHADVHAIPGTFIAMSGPRISQLSIAIHPMQVDGFYKYWGIAYTYPGEGQPFLEGDR
jgi:hypothetical protein